MKIKTSELTGAALDWAVAKCENPTNAAGWLSMARALQYSGNWAAGGPIIEDNVIELTHWGMDQWKAKDTNYQFLDTPKEHAVFAKAYGETALIAAMRCRVASKLGDEVDVPEELTK